MVASGQATEKSDLCPDHAGHVVQDLGRQLFAMGALVHAVLLSLSAYASCWSCRQLRPAGPAGNPPSPSLMSCAEALSARLMSAAPRVASSCASASLTDAGCWYRTCVSSRLPRPRTPSA